jgi:hypothetical protein
MNEEPAFELVRAEDEIINRLTSLKTTDEFLWIKWLSDWICRECFTHA